MSDSVDTKTSDRRQFRVDARSLNDDPSVNTLKITVNAGGNGVSPSGPGAQMSITGANNQPNAAYWQTASKGCTIKLPVSTWAGPPDPNDPAFIHIVLEANSTSLAYTLQTTAPIGEDAYSVNAASSAVMADGQFGDPRPSVVVNP